MEDFSPEAGDPAAFAAVEPRLPPARVSDRLTPALIEPALDAGRDRRPGRARRVDGWTPERIRIFLMTLAECGVVSDAARAAGMSKQSAYQLRHRAEGRSFHLAWAAAEQRARGRLSAELLSRALNGWVEQESRNGRVVVERRRYDNRLSMAMLTRLDQLAQARDSESRIIRVAAQEFDLFVDIASRGGTSFHDLLDRRDDPDEGARKALLLEYSAVCGRGSESSNDRSSGFPPAPEGETDHVRQP